MDAYIAEIRARLQPDEQRDMLRIIGGLLLGLGFIAIWFRREAEWGDFLIFLVLAIPTVILYGLAYVGTEATGGSTGWQGALGTFGSLLVPLTLIAGVDVIDDTPDGNLMVMLIFAASAFAAYTLWATARARFTLFLAGIYVIVAWSALWDILLGGGGIFDHDSAWRLTLLVLAGGLVAFAFAQPSEPGEQPGDGAVELVTAGGVAAVLAGGFGIGALAGEAVPLASEAVSGVPENSAFWELILLVVSVGLIYYTGRARNRGPGIVGGIGLTAFAILVGFNVGDGGNGLLIWPLLLALAGAGALFVSLNPSSGMPRSSVASSGPGDVAPTARTEVAPPVADPAPPPADPPRPPADPPPPPADPPRPPVDPPPPPADPPPPRF